jgi:hypothetical protein
MKTFVMGVVTACVLSVGVTANAAPLGRNVRKVAIPSADKLKIADAVKVTDLQKKLKDFSPTKKYRTPSGKEITGQQYLDIANKLSAAAEASGCKLGSGMSCNLIAEDAKLGPEALRDAAKLATYQLKVTPSKKSTADKDAKDPLGFSWTNQWGDPKKGAVYLGLEFGNGGGTSSAACGGDAYAGVYLFNKKKDVVRLEGEASSSGSTFTGKAGLYVLGESVWSKTGTISIDNLAFEKSFSVTQSWTYWGLVTLNLSAKVTAAAYVKAGLSGVAKTGEYTCSLNVTPGVRANVTGSAEVAILGYGEVSAGAVGVEADLTLADVSLPITASVSAKNQNNKVTFTESIKADVKMTYLSGSLDAYFKTSIPINGESILDWDKDKFTFTLLEWDGYTYNKSVFSKSATQTL